MFLIRSVQPVGSIQGIAFIMNYLLVAGNEQYWNRGGRVSTCIVDNLMDSQGMRVSTASLKSKCVCTSQQGKEED